MDRRTFLKTGTSGVGLGLLAGCLGGVGLGGGGSDSFPSEDITWHVPYGPGGTFDTYSRAVGGEMGNHLPGDVDVVVKNTEGAGGQRMIEMLQNGEPDGYDIGIYNLPGHASTQVLEGTEWDLRETSWIGLVASIPYFWYINADLPYESVEDLQNADRTLKISAISPATTGALVKAIVTSVLDIDSEIVFGYEGGPENAAAVKRGETDMDITSYDAYLSFVQGEETTPIMYMGEEAPPEEPDVQVPADVGHPELSQVARIIEPVGTTPGLPEERRQVLEDALIETINSDALQQWSEENNQPLSPAGGERVVEIVDTSVGIVNEYKDVLTQRLQA